MDFIKLTAAQAFTRFLAAQRNEHGEKLFEGVWAIFGHGNVAGLGQALHEVKDILPTFRGHNEQKPEAVLRLKKMVCKFAHVTSA